MKEEEFKLRNSKLWSGLTSLFAVILVIALIGQSLALANASYINSALGVSTTKVVQTGESGDTTYFKSSFGDFDDPAAQQALLDAAFQQNINEMREGAVLLYNNGALPLASEKQVSLFGHAAVDPVYQGSSAGTKAADGGLNVINLKTALEGQGFEVNGALWDALKAQPTTRATGEGGWGGGAMPTGSAANTEENKAFYEGQKSTWASGYKDAAIVVLSREGAEGVDMLMKDTDDDGVTVISSLALHQNEKDLLELVRAEFDKVIVLLNSPYQMEVHEILPYCDAMLFISTPGHQGFVGVADILRGEVNPSGRLVDTYATSSLSAPATVNSGTDTPKFANADQINAAIGQDESAEYISFQAENIYIGYRYYETRYADAVMGQGNASDPAGALEGAASWNYADEVQFPFGFGLSYTTFEQKLDSVDMGADEITVKATVTNTGNLAGKSVVQAYAQTPYGDYEKEHKVEKSAIQLAGFAKTGMLEPGASETVTITIDKYLLASYDVTAHNGEGGYILSDGDYYLAIGEDSHDALNNVLAAQGYAASNGMTADGDAAKAHKWNQGFDDEKYRTGANGVTVSNQFEDCDLNYWAEGAGTYLSRNDWAGTYPAEQTTVEATQEMLDILDGEWYEKPENAPSYASVAANFGVDSGLNLALMKDVSLSDRETWEKFIYQLQPEDLPNATAESFQCPAVGDISPAFGVGDGCDSVGGSLPHTVEFNGEQVNPPTTRYCSKTILTATWNTELYAERGRLMGEEGLWSGFMINYSLGGNLHRTPFGGRNYEYMSECPIMSYLASIPETAAMEAAGSHMGAKHFCNNDQEFYREGVAVFSSEQAFREGNLRAFEGALRKGGAGGIMQSFARMGLKWASASYAMNTIVLRSEWGWTGAIDTDAAPCFEEYVDGGYKNHAAEVLDAGTQEWCLDGVGGHGQWVLQKAKDTDDGHLLELLIEAAISWEYAISRSGITNGVSANAVIEHITPMWQTALTVAIAASGILTAACFVLLVVSKTKKAEPAGH